MIKLNSPLPDTVNFVCSSQDLVQNKWNGKMYKVLEITDKNVTLQREDESQFTIQKSEYFFSYYEKK